MDTAYKVRLVANTLKGSDRRLYLKYKAYELSILQLHGYDTENALREVVRQMQKGE